MLDRKQGAGDGMTQFKSEAELMGTAVGCSVGKRAKQWAEQAVFIDRLAMNEGKYAMWPKTYTTLNNAMVAAKTMQQRTMHAFKVCDWPGRFKTVITNENGLFQVWVAYTTEPEKKETHNA